jgi:hypothetical protein
MLVFLPRIFTGDAVSNRDQPPGGPGRLRRATGILPVLDHGQDGHGTPPVAALPHFTPLPERRLTLDSST